jgi:hypothetical protein
MLEQVGDPEFVSLHRCLHGQSPFVVRDAARGWRPALP